jgi:hypothetical protein
MEINRRHGGPYDRGRADSYYGRGFNPHYFIQDTYRSQEITLVAMTGDEILEYAQGYKDNEAAQNFKEWE